MNVLKMLSRNLFLTGGRNNSGKIVSFHLGGGYKKRYRFVEFVLNYSTDLKPKENAYFKQGVIVDFFRDPIRKVSLALVEWEHIEPFDFGSQKYSYVLKTADLKKKSSIFFSNKNLNGVNILYLPGSCLPLFETVPGMFVSNVSGLYARSSGCFCELIRHDFKKVLSLLGLPSGKRLWVSSLSFVVMGSVSSIKKKALRKAGETRWRNIRPKVRGVAMNPVDHPHGGGEGKTSGGRPSVSAWGKPMASRKKLISL